MSNIIEFPKISVLKITNVTYDDKSAKQVYKESQEMLLESGLRGITLLVMNFTL